MSKPQFTKKQLVLLASALERACEWEKTSAYSWKDGTPQRKAALLLAKRYDRLRKIVYALAAPASARQGGTGGTR